MDYTSRAKGLRTKQHQKNHEMNENLRIARIAAKGNLSRDEYWRTHVHTEDDIIEYYDLYYPEYTTELARALALTMTKYIKGEESVPSKLLRGSIECKANQVWNPFEDIDKEKMVGLINKTEKNMEKLLKEEQ